MPRQLIANTAAVAAGHPLGAAAGLEILQESGNAIDAVVAATLALCVVIPGSVGLGGYGGSAVIYLAESGRQGRRRGQKVVAIDFDSRAPIAFRDGLVTSELQSNYYGPRSVTVPAVVAGLDLILREFGTKSWSDVSQPAIWLAEHGFEFDAEHQRYLNRCAPHMDRQTLAALFPHGAIPKVGDCWRQSDLARLLRCLATDGPEAFYDGDIPRAIVRFLRDRGGILTEDDFRSYRPQILDAIPANLRAFELYTPPPPSGGITSLGVVQTVDRLLHLGRAEPWSAQYFHWLAEAMKICWRERQQWLGDPDLILIDFEQLIGQQAVESRANRVLNGLSSGPATSGPPISSHTANVIAIDGQGNLISLTATQGWMYGSHLVVDGLGLVLNHGMSRFDYSPDHPNAPAPGKRMQHNMAPMIALQDGRPAFACGMPGGPKIVSVTTQLVLNTVLFGATPASSIAAPRLHTDGNEPLLASTNMPADVVAELEKLGHNLQREEDMGGPVNIMTIDPQTQTIDIASGENTGAVAGF